MPVYAKPAYARPHQQSCHYKDMAYYEAWPDCPRCKINKELYPRHEHPIRNDLNLKDVAIAVGGSIAIVLTISLFIYGAYNFYKGWMR